MLYAIGARRNRCLTAFTPASETAFRMILPGLSSDTFRNLAPKRIVELVQAAGLGGIEWQDESHCPVGNLDAAARARNVTEEAGLAVISYAVDVPITSDGRNDLAVIVRTAAELGAGAIRVRAGDRPLEEADEEERDGVAARVSECVDRAEALGLMVAVGLNTYSHAATGSQAFELLQRAGTSTAQVFWHPSEQTEVETDAGDLELVSELVLGLHASGVSRTIGTSMLSEATDRWARYLAILSNHDDDFWVCLRGVEDASVDAFYRDAQTLRLLARKYGGE